MALKQPQKSLKAWTGYGREGGSMAIKDYLNIKYTHLGLKN